MPTSLKFTKECPSCGKQLSQKDLRAFSSGAGLPKNAPCPRCGTLLKWSAEYWCMTHFGGLVVFVAAMSLLASWVKLIEPLSIVVYFAALSFGTVIMFLGVLLSRLRLAKTGHTIMP